MKKRFQLLSIAFFALWASGAVAGDKVRVIEFRTEKVGEVVHWMPEKVTVSPGEKVKFVVKHELTGGFDFHGFSIRELDIMKQVDRNKTLEIEKEIPASLKAGEYKVSCHFHPKHMAAAVMVVTDKASSHSGTESQSGAGAHSAAGAPAAPSVATAPATQKSAPAASKNAPAAASKK